MDYSDIINVLSNRYNELQKEFQSVQDLVNDIDFVFDYTEEEQLLFYRMRSTMEEHSGALLRLIRYLKKQAQEESGGMFQTQHDPNFDDVDPKQKAMAMHHCGQDADLDDACCQAREKDPVGDASAAVKDSAMVEFQNIHIHKGNIPREQQGCIKNLSLVGMQVIAIGDQRCDRCRQDRYGEPCVKLELVGGHMLCLAPLPNSIITE